MKWIFFAGLLFISLHAGSNAQPLPSPPVKILMIMERPAGSTEKGFADYLRRRGVETDISVTDCHATPGACELQPLLADIQQKKPVLLYVSGVNLAVRLMTANLTIPLLCVGIPDIKLIDSNWSLNQSTGHPIFGVAYLPSAAEQVAALKSYAQVKKIGILASATNPWVPILIRDLQNLPESESLEVASAILTLPADKELAKGEVTKALESMASQNIDFIYLAGDEALYPMADIIQQTLSRLKLASFCVREEDFQTFHPLYGFYADTYQLGQLAGVKAEGILRQNGDKETPYTFQILKSMTTSLNLNMIKQLPHRLTPPVAFFRFAEIYTPAPPQGVKLQVTTLPAPHTLSQNPSQ